MTDTHERRETGPERPQIGHRWRDRTGYVTGRLIANWLYMTRDNYPLRDPLSGHVFTEAGFFSVNTSNDPRDLIAPVEWDADGAATSCPSGVADDTTQGPERGGPNPYPSPPEIWLEPECCPVDERSWCSAPQENCTERDCGLPWVRYVRADMAATELSRLRESCQLAQSSARVAERRAAEAEASSDADVDRAAIAESNADAWERRALDSEARVAALMEERQRAREVKPLEWEDDHTAWYDQGTRFAAKDPWGECYRVSMDDDHTWHVDHDQLSITPDCAVESEEAAKAFAQADYEARIRSALAAHSAGEVEHG